MSGQAPGPAPRLKFGNAGRRRDPGISNGSWRGKRVCNARGSAGALVAHAFAATLAPPGVTAAKTADKVLLSFCWKRSAIFAEKDVRKL